MILSKLKILLLMVMVSLSFFVAGYSNAEEFSMPAKIQWKMGTPIDEISCKSGFELILKKSDNSPACVKENTAIILLKRGWASEILQNPKTPQTPREPIPSDLDVISANNHFAINFYSQVSKDNQENIFYSPWSISTAFAIAYEGAKDNTAKQIQETFGFPVEYEKRTSEYKNSINNLNPKDSPYQLSVANALWIKENFKPRQEYMNTAKSFYNSDVNTAEFTSADGIDSINSWVSQKTNEKIKKLFEYGSLDEYTRLVITNAIYFKGTWETQFEKSDTTDEPFWITSENNTPVPLMRLDSKTFDYYETQSMKILKMPYEGDRLSMTILLPNEIDGLSELEESISVENLKKWNEQIGPTKVEVYIPKFKMETEYDLKGSLTQMGMIIPFSSNEANFEGIAPDLYIQKAIHKAFVEVNEEGTEAAGATGIAVGVTSAGPPTPVFRADHPFVFLIQDDTTGNILFIGRVSDPTK